MESHEISLRLVNAVTTYDRKQSTKKYYNVYALAQYLKRVGEIVADIERGADVRKAVVTGFSGRIADACLKALQLPKSTRDEALGGMVYQPVMPAPDDEE
jgi:hypothetical protein